MNPTFEFIYVFFVVISVVAKTPIALQPLERWQFMSGSGYLQNCCHVTNF